MKRRTRKQRISAWVATLLLLMSLLPLTVFAEGENEGPEPPYEKVLYQNGDWFLEHMAVGSDVRAVVGYRGSYATDPALLQEPMEPIPVAIGSDSLVTAIHVPYAYPPEAPDLETVNVVVLDTAGNTYGPYGMVPRLVQGAAEPVVTTDEAGNEILVEGEPQDIYVAYSVLIDGGLFLSEGQYFLHTTDNARIVRNSGTGVAGAAMVVGVDYEAWLAYMEAVEASGVPVIHDFTGRYSVDVDAWKTSTLMGPVDPPTNSFSLRSFELTVIDQGDVIQLVGMYEGMPFSQMCPVDERTETWVSATFSAMLDLTRLPYAARIGGYGALVLEKPESGPATLALLGEATYERAATADKGADSNTYDLQVNGSFAGSDLPAFVAAALAARMPNAGGVPGPDTAGQAAVGALFPPLIAVVAHVIQNILIAQDNERKARAAAKKKASQRDKEWYKNKYPGKTDSEIASIMMADALGNTDEPDDDPFSESDGDAGGSASDSEGGNASGDDYNEEAGEEPDYGETEEEPAPEPEVEREPEPETEKEPPAAEPEATAPQEPAPEPKPVEPETKKIQIDRTGTVVDAVRDPATGEWINPETGNAINTEIARTQGEEWKKDNEAIERNREVNDKSGSEWDKKIRADDKARKEALEVANVQAKIMSKHGTTDKASTMTALNQIQAADKRVADAYTNAGNVAAVYEEAAKVTVNVADAAIDGMGNALGPAGRGIRAGYKVAKGVAETTAEQGLSWQNAGSGFVKGGLDAASDFTNPKWSGKAQQALKSGLQIGSEVFGETTSSKGKGFVEGLKKGVVKAGLDAIPDAASKGFGGDVLTTQLKNGQVRLARNTVGQWSGKVVTKNVAENFIKQKTDRQLVQTGVKTVVNLTNEYVIKPRM